MNPLVSIIVPMYNAESYILSCLNSIVGQSYDNLEIIVVNDGSTDHSVELCRNFAVAHNNVLILNQENSGLSSARNNGIKQAHGEYLFFLDADDLLQNSAIEKMIENTTDGGNLVICNYRKFNDNEKCSLTEKLPNKSITYTVEEYLNEILEFRRNTYAWGILVKKEIAKNNLFPLGKYFEDLATVYKYICESSSITFVDQELLFYRQSLNSIVATMNAVKCKDYYDAAVEMTSYIKAQYPSLANSASNFMCYVALQVVAISDSKDNYIEQARRYLRQNALTCQRTTSSKSLSIKIRLWNISEWAYKSVVRIKQSDCIRGILK